MEPIAENSLQVTLSFVLTDPFYIKRRLRNSPSLDHGVLSEQETLEFTNVFSESVLLCKNGHVFRSDVHFFEWIFTKVGAKRWLRNKMSADKL